MRRHRRALAFLSVRQPCQPFLGRLDPYFDQLIPIVDTVDKYDREVTAFLGNVSSALNGESVPGGTQTPVKFIRATGPLGPAVLGSPPSPYKISRLNAYVKPGGYTKLSEGLDSFYTAHCTSGLTAELQQGDFDNDLYNRTQLYAMGGAGVTSTDDVPTPPCRQQGKINSIGGPPDEKTYYPHVNEGG